MDYQVCLFLEDEWVPNNPGLPVVVYRKVFDENHDDLATAFEDLFRGNGWPPQWRDTVHDRQHYHSTAHEALGVAAGHAKLLLGGPRGTEVDLRAGDAIVLPAGTGHCRTSASDDFAVVGAYPVGQAHDMCLDAPTDDQRRRIESLPLPGRDPVEGAGGLLLRCYEALS